MGRGRSKAGGGSAPQTAPQAATPQAPPPVTPPTKQQIAQGNILPKGGVPFADFEKMTDDQKADVVDTALQTGVPLFLDRSGIQRFAYLTGMNDKPTVVSEQKLNSMSGKDLFRTVNDGYNSQTDVGYTSKDIYNQICNGDFTMYASGGGTAHGKGIYFADSFGESILYGNGAKYHPITMRAKLTTNKTITESKLSREYNSALARGDKLAKACSRADYASRENLYALAKGYDCVVSPSSGYYMVLNRRCLAISDTTKPAKGSRW